MTKSCEVLADLIHYHHHGDCSHSNSNHEKDGGDLVQHRLTYVGVAGYLARLLKTPDSCADGKLS